MAETRLLTGWGRTPASAARVEIPRRAGDVTLDPLPRGHLARGLGKAYGDAALNAGGTVWEMTSLDTLDLDPAAGTIRADAGVSLDRLLRELVPRGWFLPVTPGTRFVTVGGALAADVHGKNHHRDGSFSRFVESFRLLAPTGVRDVAPGTDLFAATAGGMGLTGVILDVTFRLVPIETSLMVVETTRTPDLEATLAALVAADTTHRYSVAWVDLLARGRHLGRGVLTAGDHAPGDAELAPPRRPLVSVPDVVPGWVLSPLSIRAFNEAWYRRAPLHRADEPQPFPAFFYPLDAVGDWNRMYGRAGFTQWQCVVPVDATDALREIIERFARSGAPSFLVVLKRFGPGEGLLSFPAPGWTLAVDLAARHRDLAPLLDGLDRIVAGVGGRLYLAKDSRMSRSVVPDMYPDLDRWREIRAGVDPRHLLRSDLDRRLDLTGAGDA